LGLLVVLRVAAEQLVLGLAVLDVFLGRLLGELDVVLGLGPQALAAVGRLLQQRVEQVAKLALAVAEVHQRDLVLLVLRQLVGRLGVLIDRELEGLEQLELGLGRELGLPAAAAAAAAALLVEVGLIDVLLER